jgi:hypothetical protein
MAYTGVRLTHAPLPRAIPGSPWHTFPLFIYDYFSFSVFSS